MKSPSMVFSIPACALIVLPGVAFANHPLDWAPEEMFTYGILSGIVYSVFGFEHLFFVLAAGLAAALAGRPYSAPAAYVVAMLGGTVLASTGMGLPIVETMIALSLLCLGGLLVWGRKARLGTTLGLFVGFGLFHGSDFGESPAAQEAGDSLEVFDRIVAGPGNRPVSRQRGQCAGGAGMGGRRSGWCFRNTARGLCRCRNRPVPGSRDGVGRHLRNSGIQLIAPSPTPRPGVFPSTVLEESWLRAFQ